MNIRYVSGAIVSIPLLPVLYFQGKQVRSTVPKLPEATGTEGETGIKRLNQRSLNVIILGESTMAGVGVPTHDEGFSGTFARELSQLLELQVSWKVFARNGYTARQLKDKLVPEIIEEQADLIVIGLGGNDAFTLNTPSRWKADIESLITAIRDRFPKSSIVFCNMPPIKEFPAFTPLMKWTIGNLVEILGNELQNVVNEHKNVHYTGERITLKGWIEKFQLDVETEAFFSDGVHPARLTYQTWARDVANIIVERRII